MVPAWFAFVCIGLGIIGGWFMHHEDDHLRQSEVYWKAALVESFNMLRRQIDESRQRRQATLGGSAVDTNDLQGPA